LRGAPLAPARQAVADTACGSDALGAQIVETGAAAVVLPRRKRRRPPHPDPPARRDRNQAERLSNRLRQFRGVATRYDKPADFYAAFVQPRAVTRWLN